MTTPTPAPLDLTPIRATVRRALQEHPRPPRNSEVRQITAELRGHLQRMVREAQRRADGIERGTEAWIRWSALIMRAEDDLYRVGEAGTHAAATRMNDLGRTCRRLADCLDEW
ncbi:DUF6415 family natural product biosynthesis protein [Streptomyces sp. ET3-23]|uniref:DUF6415 family natural product biosynthesis protein n=1 Tax=Streptomyces sp. ET3-23 TaxID=2885643 RepID=UPI001D0F924B|nr:DUF6415 family natural product biosynthesis protein [Streptomyces sp. ET3-23]MCC2278331.1 DUF6415 family natural product biosynthesis protein [Streptomyces sp. ET3-23]